MHEINKIKLSYQTKFWLSEIMGIENYFYQEINHQKSCSKKLNTYVTIFDYIDNILIISSLTSTKHSWETKLGEFQEDQQYFGK